MQFVIPLQTTLIGSFVKTFKQFLSEEYVEKVDGLKDSIDIVNRFCKDWLENPIEIYRGMRDSGQFITVNPIEKKRRSANTSNYYTVFFDELLPEEYPPRSYSLICSTSERKARGFGHTYQVIPFDGARIGIVGTQDLWNKGIKLGDSRVQDIDILNNRIRDALGSQGQDSWEDFVKEVHAHSTAILDTFEMTPEEFIDEIKDAYSARRMGFKAITTKDLGALNSHRDSEIWIGEKCLLVRSDMTYNFRTELGLKS